MQSHVPCIKRNSYKTMLWHRLYRPTTNIRCRCHSPVVRTVNPVLRRRGTIRAAASTRVVNYRYSSIFATLELVTFYFRLQISISGCSCLQSVDALLKLSLWKLGALRFHLSTRQPEIDLNIYMNFSM